MLPTMRFAPLALVVLLVPILAVAPGCKPREPELPPPPPPAAPVSIWGTTQSQDVANKLVEAALRESWTSQFRDRNARPARIIVGEITDRSGKSVPVDEVVAAITSALGAEGGDKLAAAGADAADYTVTGVIASSAGTMPDGAPAVFFAIDLSFAASGDTAWHFAIELPVADR
jgi:hypothetical protein